MIRAILAAALALLSGPAWAETNPIEVHPMTTQNRKPEIISSVPPPGFSCWEKGEMVAVGSVTCRDGAQLVWTKEDANVPPPDKSAPKFGPDCGQGAVWDSIAHQCTTILPQNDPYRDITIGQPGMTTIRCEHDPERIEITPGSEVRIFCKGVAP